VVLATFNRPVLLARLLGQLSAQTLPPGAFEVIVIDDGSSPAVGACPPGLPAVPFRLDLLRQDNAGAPRARHRGMLAARGEVVVVTDDDMQVEPGFLAAHLARHGPGSRRVVVGRIRPSAAVVDMPLFERFHADLLGRWSSRRVRGDILCTGNVSFRRADYLDVGGFDVTLELAEDMELGLRLEQAGVEVVFAEEAFTVHDSDHTDFAAWRRRALAYGRQCTLIGRKLPTLAHADPWRFFFGGARAKRPFVSAAVALPRLGGLLAGAVHRAALASDRLGLERLALRLTGLLWDVEFFRGVRAEAGGLAGTLRSCAGYLAKVEASAELAPGVGPLGIRLGRAARRVLRDGRPHAAN
jgi:GT2 family glycosyltransferase